MLSDHRPGQRCAEKILVLIHRSGAQGGEDVIAEELLAQIFDYNFGGSGLAGLLHHRANVIALANVGDHGDDFTVVVFLEPGNDDGGIEAPRVRQYNSLTHDYSLNSWTRDAPRRSAGTAKWPSARACGFPPGRKPPSAANRSPQPPLPRRGARAGSA